MNMRIAGIAAALVVVCTPVQNKASDLDALQGRWVTAKTNQEGQAFSQVIEIEKDQLTFQIVDAESKPRFFSTGTIKATKAAPFDWFTISDIRAGRSRDDMQSVDDSRALVYTVRDGNLFLASNFDTVRGNEKPGVEIYVRKEAAAADAGLVGKWKMEVTMGDNTLDYELRISKAGNQLEGVLVSPRSGEHRCKSVRFANGELVIEVDREIEGNALLFVYQAKLTSDGLSGKVQVKDQDQFSGTWKASRK